MELPGEVMRHEEQGMASASKSGSALGSAREEFAKRGILRLRGNGSVSAKFRTGGERGVTERKPLLRNRSGLLGYGDGAAAFGFVPRVINAVNYSEIGADGKNEEGNGKRVRNPVQKSAENQQHQTLGALPEADAAAINERFGASLGVTDHHCASDGKAGEEGKEEAIDSGIVNEQADENSEVSVAVKNGLQKGAEIIDAGLAMGERTREKIGSGCRNHGNASREEAARAEKDCGNDAKSEAGEGEKTGRNTGAIETTNSALEDPAKGPAESIDANRHNAGAGRR